MSAFNVDFEEIWSHVRPDVAGWIQAKGGGGVEIIVCDELICCQ